MRHEVSILSRRGAYGDGMAKQVSCREMGIDCAFQIRDGDEAELVAFVQQHAKNVHDMELSAEEVRDVMRET